METISEILKLVYILILRSIRKIFFVLPVKKNRVIFESFSGVAYSCNPKYISEKLKEKYGDNIEIVWAVKNKNILPDGTLYCKYRSFKHFLFRITSKVYICNYLQAIEIPKRKEQIEIQTWHGGGCYKKVGVDERKRSSIYEIRRDMHIKETDFFIASSKYWEDEVMRKQFKFGGKALEIGMPRNDCLVGKTDLQKVNAIKEKIGVEDNTYMILYAPTWREGADRFETLDYDAIALAFSEKFGKKCQIVFRAHLYGKEKAKNIIDMTDYPDMQELLYASDALITDYSSSMWDYSLTGKPCFLYVPDLHRYVQQRGFDKDIHTWGFPVCESNRELIYQINSFNENDFKLNMKYHQQNLESFEKGNASEKMADLIAEICGV